MTAIPEREALTIRVEGVFDVPAARLVEEALLDTRGKAIHVDVTQVREFHDFAVALLARALAGRQRTTVAGLRQHHVRLLRYLGIEPDVEAPLAAAAPPEAG